MTKIGTLDDGNEVALMLGNFKYALPKRDGAKTRTLRDVADQMKHTIMKDREVLRLREGNEPRRVEDAEIEYEQEVTNAISSHK